MTDQPASGDTTARIPAVGVEVPDVVQQNDVRLSGADQVTVEALRPGTALLISHRGPGAGAKFLLDSAEVSSGRHPDSDIFLDDVTVSRRHAIFRSVAGGYVVQDVGSLNGTYVNGEITDSAPLVTGTEVQIGKFRLVYYGAVGS